MSTLCENVLYTQAKQGKLARAFAVKMVTNNLVVQFAKNAGYDALWVEMEHSTFSLGEASTLTSTALMAGLTPIVRVPYQCGMGYVQQVLDTGAMIVVFPHVSSADQAREAVQMCKLPPLGKRSLWLQQAAVGLRVSTPQKLAQVLNAEASAVGVMIETADAVANIGEIAGVPRVDLLMVGCIDLSSEMGMLAEFDNPVFCQALEAVSRAAKKHHKVFGLAGNYNNPKFCDWVINTLGVRLFLCEVDANILSTGAMEGMARMDRVDRSSLPN